MRTRTVVPIVSLFALAALSGCGGTAGTPSGKHVLTKADATSAMLSLTDVGAGFTRHRDDGNHTNMGCFSKSQGVTRGKIRPETKVQQAYDADTEVGLPSLFSGVASFRSTAGARSGLAGVLHSLQGCTAVDVTDHEFHYKLTIRYNRDKTGPEADEQLNVSAVGTMTTHGFTVPMEVHFSLVRIANDIEESGIATISDDASADAAKVSRAALAKLAAVVAGRTAPKAGLHFAPVNINDYLSNTT